MSALNHLLPEELCAKINDMACRKVVNGNEKSNELILIFKLNETATDVHDELMQWLFKRLDTISDDVFNDRGQYEWNIISQIIDNDYKDEDEDGDENEDNYIKIKNTIVVAIHIPDHYWISTNNDGLTIPYNYSPSITACATLSPQYIMDCLIREPVFIREIGVSAVSSDVMMDWWEEMISTDPNHFDIAGKGYMVHPMWMKFPPGHGDHPHWGSWVSIREKSFNFGWKGYMVNKS